MAKSVGYKDIPTNKNVGYKTHGSFKMSGNKKGNTGTAKAGGSHKGLQKAQESLAPQESEVFMKKAIAHMRKQGKKVNGRVAMADGSGAFH